MAFKPFESILLPDSRFHAMCIIEDGKSRPFELADLHESLASIGLNGAAPADVQDAFDRARSAMIYAFFDYDLFVLGEIQALGAFELALRFRLDGRANVSRGTLRNLVDRARKVGVLPPYNPDLSPVSCPIELLIFLRNSLSHGTAEIHLPGDAIGVAISCARWIDYVFPVPS